MSSRAARWYKTLLVWPYAVAPAVAGVLWLFMFAPSVGVVSHALRAIGIEWNHLLDGTDAMILVVLTAVWKQISYNFLFFLAGLQRIPKSLIEAAAIDGAGPWRRFWTMLFPLLTPTTFFLLVINIIYAFFEHLRDRRHRHRGRARARTPRSSSTRSTSTASRRSTSAARRRSRWC